MNKELSSLNHNETVFIYRRGGEGEGEGGPEREGAGRGITWSQRETEGESVVSYRV